MQEQMLADMLSRRRDRAIAIILGVKERDCDPFLPHDSKRKIRKVVLDQLNDFHDFCSDIIRSLEGNSGVVLNEAYLEKLDAIHELVVELTAE